MNQSTVEKRVSLTSIDGDLPPILARLQISPEQWKINTMQFEAIHDRQFNRLIPSIDTG
ncbi:MAG: hypothetical protein GY814_06215 [Gammaproteobacteria bacterium]|nr:hypothetical protein [Gammaproteobacteria bacterium]